MTPPETPTFSEQEIIEAIRVALIDRSPGLITKEESYSRGDVYVEMYGVVSINDIPIGVRALVDITKRPELLEDGDIKVILEGWE